MVVENDEKGSSEPPPPELLDTLERFGVGLAWFFKAESDLARSGEYYMRVVLEPELQNPAKEDVNKYILRFIGALSDRKEEISRLRFDRFSHKHALAGTANRHQRES